jgi:hypothetical protein
MFQQSKTKKQASARDLRFKVSNRGAVSVYGFGRFPVTLYYDQWFRLFDSEKELRSFMKVNKTKLKMKNPSPESD